MQKIILDGVESNLKCIFNLKNKINIFYILLLFLPIIDLITALQTRFTNMVISLGVLIKGLLLLFILYYLFFKNKNKNSKVIKLYLLILAMFSIIYLLTKNDIVNINNLLTEIINIFKFSFYPIVTIGLIEMDNENKLDKNIIANVLSYTYILYIIFIFIPHITGTGFKSYGLLSIKNGTVGWFYSANEIGSIMILLFNFVYLHLENKKYYLFLVASLIGIYVSSIIGTKVASLGIIIATCTMLVYNIIDKKTFKTKNIMYSLIILFTSITFFLLGPTLNNVGDTYSRYVINNQNENKNVLVRKLESFMISLLSDREKFLSGVDISYKHAPIDDKLFGLGFTPRDSHYSQLASRLVEMDYFDMFYRFGIIGFILLNLPALYIIGDIIWSIIKRKQKTNANFWKYLIIWGVVTLIGFVSGHVISSPAVSFYLAIITLFMYKSLQKEV